MVFKVYNPKPLAPVAEKMLADAGIEVMDEEHLQASLYNL